MTELLSYIHYFVSTYWRRLNANEYIRTLTIPMPVSATTCTHGDILPRMMSNFQMYYQIPTLHDGVKHLIYHIINSLYLPSPRLDDEADLASPSIWQHVCDTAGSVSTIRRYMVRYEKQSISFSTPYLLWWHTLYSMLNLNFYVEIV